MYNLTVRVAYAGAPSWGEPLLLLLLLALLRLLLLLLLHLTLLFHSCARPVPYGALNFLKECRVKELLSSVTHKLSLVPNKDLGFQLNRSYLVSVKTVIKVMKLQLQRCD